ncbi:hypothetical protein ACLB2K_066726 [Fragaria x ananassa]
MKWLMCLLLGITGTDQPGVYLGLPTIWGRSENEVLAYIKEKQVNMLDGWKQKLQSQASKGNSDKVSGPCCAYLPYVLFWYSKGYL